MAESAACVRKKTPQITSKTFCSEGVIANTDETISSLPSMSTARQNMLNCLEVAYFEMDFNGRLQDYNETAGRMFGYSQEIMPPPNLFDTVCFKHAQKITNTLTQVRTSGQPSPSIIFDVICKNCLPRTMKATFSLHVDARKGPIGYLAMAKDISPSIQKEKNVLEGEESFLALLDAAPYAIIISRISDQRYLFFNKAFQKLTGYTRDETLGKTAEELGILKSSSDRLCLQQTFKKKCRLDGFKVSYCRKDGRITNALISARRIWYMGEDAILFVSHNIEHMAMEKVRALKGAQNDFIKQEKLALLEQLTTTVSHELRNPLGVIRTSNFYLQRKIGIKDGKTEKHFKRIDEQITLCDTIMDDLLEYTCGRRISAVKQEVTPWLAETVHKISKQENLFIELKLPPNLPQLRHDREKLRRVLKNLLINAAQAVKAKAEKMTNSPDKYTPEICVEAAANQNQFLLMVTDNGTGMNLDTLKHAFEPLFSTRARGTGIGLAIVKKIIEEHGGRIVAESQLGTGTRITLSFSNLFKPNDKIQGGQT